MVPLRLRSSDVEIHHPGIVHSSEPNQSERRRCGLTLRYIYTATLCWDPSQPVLMMRGEPVPDVNSYRSWPPYRPGESPSIHTEPLAEPRHAHACQQAA